VGSENRDLGEVGETATQPRSGVRVLRLDELAGRRPSGAEPFGVTSVGIDRRPTASSRLAPLFWVRLVLQVLRRVTPRGGASAGAVTSRLGRLISGTTEYVEPGLAGVVCARCLPVTPISGVRWPVGVRCQWPSTSSGSMCSTDVAATGSAPLRPPSASSSRRRTRTPTAGRVLQLAESRVSDHHRGTCSPRQLADHGAARDRARRSQVVAAIAAIDRAQTGRPGTYAEPSTPPDRSSRKGAYAPRSSSVPTAPTPTASPR